MTVVFAFADAQENAAFLGADDIEFSAGARCEKAVATHKRFLVAGVSVDTPYEAARNLEVFGSSRIYLRDGTAYPSPNSVEECCRLTEAMLVRYAPRRWQAFESAPIDARTEERRELLTQPHGRLVILDALKMRLAFVDFGVIFPPRSRYTWRIQEFAQNRVWRFGVDGPTDMGDIPREAYADPYAWCAANVKTARDYVENRA